MEDLDWLIALAGGIFVILFVVVVFLFQNNRTSKAKKENNKGNRVNNNPPKVIPPKPQSQSQPKKIEKKVENKQVERNVNKPELKEVNPPSKVIKEVPKPAVIKVQPQETPKETPKVVKEVPKPVVNANNNAQKKQPQNVQQPPQNKQPQNKQQNKQQQNKQNKNKENKNKENNKLSAEQREFEKQKEREWQEQQERERIRKEEEENAWLQPRKKKKKLSGLVNENADNSYVEKEDQVRLLAEKILKENEELALRFKKNLSDDFAKYIADPSPNSKNAAANDIDDVPKKKKNNPISPWRSVNIDNIIADDDDNDNDNYPEL